MPTSTTPAALIPPAQWGVGEQVPGEVFSGLSDDELLDVIAADERLAAWVTAHSVAAVGELARRAEADAVTDLDVDASVRARNLALVGARESVVDEIALASGLGQRAVVTRIQVARGDRARFGAVREALAAGQMSWSRVVQFTDRTANVDSQRVPGIAVKVLAPWAALATGENDPQKDAGGLAVPQAEFSQRLSRAVAAARTADRRRRDAVAQRDARAVLNPEGDGALTVTGDAARVAAATSRVDAIARRLRKEGDSRTLAQLRSDVALDLLQFGELSAAEAAAITGALNSADGSERAGSGNPVGHGSDADVDCAAAGTSSRSATPGLAAVLAPYATFGGQLPPARVDVSVSAATLLGISREPGTILCGSVEQWLSADQVRRIAYQAGSTWRRIVTDPATGYMADYSTKRYEVTGTLRERVFARDRYSRVPGSTRPAVFCDTDHDLDYAAGGPSSEANLSAKNRRGHNHKTHRRWKSEREPGVHGEITWTTPAGRTYSTRPHDYREVDTSAWKQIRELVRSHHVPEIDPDNDPCQSCLGCETGMPCPTLPAAEVSTTDAAESTAAPGVTGATGADQRVNRILTRIGTTRSNHGANASADASASSPGVVTSMTRSATTAGKCDAEQGVPTDESPAVVTRPPRRARHAGTWNPDDDLTPSERWAPTAPTSTGETKHTGWGASDPGPPPF